MFRVEFKYWWIFSKILFNLMKSIRFVMLCRIITQQLSTQKVEARGSWVWSKLALHSKTTFSQKKKKKATVFFLPKQTMHQKEKKNLIYRIRYKDISLTPLYTFPQLKIRAYKSSCYARHALPHGRAKDKIVTWKLEHLNGWQTILDPQYWEKGILLSPE
jgi:hypothetical protein